MTWRYIATRMNGDGTETLIDGNIPFSGVEVHNVVNGNGGITGTITPEVAHLRIGGEPALLPWQTAIYAEADGHIRGGGILTEPDEDDPALTLNGTGHAGYLSALTYSGIKSVERGDPLVLARHLWDHAQAKVGANLGVQLAGAEKSRDMFVGDDSIEPTTTPTKVTPYVLAYWQTHDLGRELDALAELAPFEYTMSHAWDGDTIRHTLTFGYPRLGARRSDLRFAVGENIAEVPSFHTDPGAYASNVIVLGAGEGSKMLRAPADEARPPRLRREVVVMDKTIVTPSMAQKRAAAERKALTGEADVDEVQVVQHPHAELGSYQVGDDIRLDTADGWTDRRSVWVRILGIVIKPESNVTTLQVRRSEKVRS